MNCESVQAAVLDESVARSESVDAHLATCAACSAVASAHRQALQLRGTAPLMTARRSPGEVRKRAGVAFGLVLALGGGVGLLALERSSEPERRVAVRAEPEERAVLSAPVGEGSGPQVVRDGNVDAEWVALVMLQHSAERVVLAEYREEAATRRAFGALPAWVAPRKSSPVRSLGRAASPVVFTQEDVP
jgi:hypothetical protein